MKCGTCKKIINLRKETEYSVVRTCFGLHIHVYLCEICAFEMQEHEDSEREERRIKELEE